MRPLALLLFGAAGCGHAGPPLEGWLCSKQATSDHSRFIDITTPGRDRRIPRRFAGLGDRAVERFAAQLGVPTDGLRIRVHLCGGTDGFGAGLERALPIERPGRTTRHGEVFVRAGLDELWTAPDLTGDLEAYFLHELAHAVARKRSPRFVAEPIWFQEGMVELMARWFLGSAPDLRTPELNHFANETFSALLTLERRNFIPLGRLSDLQRREWNRQVGGPQQEEAYTLLESLTASDPAARRRLEALLTALPRPSHFAEVFAALFGKRAALEATWRTWLKRAPPPLWTTNMALRMNAHGGLWIRLLGRFGMALNGRPELRTNTELLATLQLESSQTFSIFFAAGKDRVLAVELDHSGYTRLFEIGKDGSDKTLSASKRQSKMAGSPGKRDLRVRFDSGRVRVMVEQEEALDEPLPCEPAGVWGISLSDGAASLKGIRVADLPPDARGQAATDFGLGGGERP